LKESKIVIVGAGAAGIAIAKLLHTYAAPNIIMVDSKGIIGKSRTDLNSTKIDLLEFTNPNTITGDLSDALEDADIFIGVSQPGLLTKELIQTMAKDPVIFAMANPIPEIMPDEAKKAGAFIIATGRSDFPNQVNNALAFPGIFKGALDNRIRRIDTDHKIAAAEAIAGLVDEPTVDKIIPSIFDERLVPAISALFKEL
jgi:malate dehydrogenase (oxaloacetate-decarboxylating)